MGRCLEESDSVCLRLFGFRAVVKVEAVPFFTGSYISYSASVFNQKTFDKINTSFYPRIGVHPKTYRQR